MSREHSAGKESFSWKNFGKSQWLILALLGLLLVVIAMPAGGERDASGSAETTAFFEEEPDADASAREQQLARLLENVEGVGKVQVMLCPADAGSGQYFSTDQDASVGGALIVAEGADNPVTEQKIRRAVQALFQIESHKIEVMKMK